MKHIYEMSKLTHKIARDEEGGVLIIVGFVLFTLLLVVGFAVDYGRAQLIQDRIQSALDAGAMAGAAVSKGNNIQVVENEAQDYLNANYRADIMGSAVPDVAATYIPSRNGQGQGIHYEVAPVAVTSYILGPLGFNMTLEVGAKAEVNTLPADPLDVVVAIDISGSMAWRDGTGAQCVDSEAPSWAGDVFCACHGTPGLCGSNSRIAKARPAIKELRAALDSPGNRFGIVPWDHRVNLSNAISNPFFSGPDAYVAGFDVNNDNINRAFFPGITPAVTYLTEDKSRFDGAVDALQASYNTDPGNGMLWALRQFIRRGVTGNPPPNAAASPTAPGTFEWIGWKDPAPNKAIVFMTDGFATFDFNQPADKTNPVQLTNAQRNSAYATFRNMCNAAKNMGINVYTVTYNLPVGSSDPVMFGIVANMLACASEPVGTHAFNAADGAGLQAAMRRISDDLMMMRLTK